MTLSASRRGTKIVVQAVYGDVAVVAEEGLAPGWRFYRQLGAVLQEIEAELPPLPPVLPGYRPGQEVLYRPSAGSAEWEPGEFLRWQDDGRTVKVGLPNLAYVVVPVGDVQPRPKPDSFDSTDGRTFS